MKLFQRFYEGIMVILVMFTIITLWTEETHHSILNWIVWLIFATDFFVRLYFSEQKWTFIKKNPFLVIAIIPLDQFFQLARIVRVVYLFRIKTITKYYIQPAVDRLTYQSKTVLFAALFFLLALEALVIQLLEGIDHYFSSLIYVLGHLMFFGRKMLETESSITIWCLTVTSIIGIILHGLAIQWAFTKVESLYKKYANSQNLNG
ncbi:transporter [Cytobacillus sp. FJAT-54145]|uniref:Transporter n=1 Tax=Cytobacillus spartinae TaxID=3299023 RepID=A0ABW6KF31_9BACI